MAHPGPSRPRAPDIPIHPRPRMAPAPVKILRGAAEQERIRLGKRRTNVGRPKEFDPAIIAESGFLLANSDVVDKKRLFKFFGIKPESRAGSFPTYNFLDARLPLIPESRAGIFPTYNFLMQHSGTMFCASYQRLGCRVPVTKCWCGTRRCRRRRGILCTAWWQTRRSEG